MTKSGDVVRSFYDAVIRRDFATARTFLHERLEFVGLFETYPNPAAYLTALTGLMSITRKLDIRTIIGEGDEAAIFFVLETGPPAEATTLVAEWHELRDGKIARVHSAFDGRPFAAMFGAAKA